MKQIHTILARIGAFCLAALLLCTCALADGSGTVTASLLNIRSSASTSSAIVGTIPKGATVSISETLDGWYKISYNGLSGYVKAEYVKSTDSGTSQTGTVTGNYVNIRSAANTSASVLANVSKGTTLTVTGSEGNWYKLSYNGRTAYICSDYVSLGDSSQSSQSGTVNGSYVRLRSGASLSSSIVKVLNKGAEVTVTGSEGDWYKVSCSGTAGYVYKTYVTLSSAKGSDSSNKTTEETGTINGTYVRLRSGASTSSSIVQVLDKGAKMTVTGSEGDWYKVSYNGKTGYVYKTYLTLGSAGDSGTTVTADSGTGTVRGMYVRVRSGASTSSSILATVNTGTAMTITGTTGEWYQVSYNGKTGYIYKSYLVKDGEKSTPADAGSAGEAIAAKAQEYLGVPYVYGGTSPSGFDCSGFVYYVYKQMGYSIYRTASAQYCNGVYVERSNLQPGDIIIFYNSGMSAIGHAGLYIGNGKFIHASSGGGKVQINNLSDSYYNTHYYGARRVVS